MSEAVLDVAVDGFGPVWPGLENNPEGAIAKLMKERTGEVPHAYKHPDLGWIGFVYGDTRMGLAHIASKRGTAFLDKLPQVLRTGRVVRDPKLPRVYIADRSAPANVAVVRLSWDNKDKTWVVTFYEDDQGHFKALDQVESAGQVRLSNEPPASAASRIPAATRPKNAITEPESVLDAVGALERIKLSAQLAGKVKELAQVASPLQRVKVAKQVADLLQQLGAGAPAPAAKIRNFGWDAVKLADLSMEDLQTLREQVQIEHANPRDADGRYLEGGQPSLYLYDKKGRWKLDKLAWAVTYKLQEKRDAQEPAGETVQMPGNWREKLLKDAEPRDIVLPAHVRAQLDAHEGMFEDASLRGEPSEEDILQRVKAITAANFSKENQHAAKLKSSDAYATEMRKAIDLLALSRTLAAIGTRKNAQVPDGFTQVGAPYFQAATRYKNGATGSFASALGIAAFLAAIERHLAKPKRPSTASFDKHLTQLVTPPQLDLPTIEHDGDTWYILSTGTRREDGKVFAHLSSTTRGREVANGVQPIQENDYIDLPEPGVTDVDGAAPAAHEIVEYTTKKGKVIRGVIRTDLTYAEAKAIDEYTWKHQGGYFIREKHLDGYVPPAGNERPAPTPKPELTPEEQAQAEADRLANEQAVQQTKRAQQAAKLREVAASTLEKAEASINQDRNTNTARRARMAQGVVAAAEADRALALTLNNLADAIENGQATHLSGITSRAALQSLQDMLRSAMYEAERGLSYADQQRQKGRAPTLADVEHAKMPMPKWGTAGASISGVLDAIKGKKGSVELAKKIRFSPGPDAEMISALKAMIGDKETSYQIGWWNLEQVAKVARLKRAGISTDRELKDALGEYLQFREGAREEDPIKKAERAIIGQKVGIDFFPTPAATAARMASLARIKKGDRVLEPSAGNGNLADAAKSAGAEVDVIEISSQLREILTAKGYNVVAFDFDAFEPEEQYDAVLMNPPFSSRQDAAHVMRAYRMVKSGGHLVAIAGEGVFFGSDAKAVQFRDWLDSVGAEVESLDQNTFKDKSLLATTGANARLIVIQK